MTYCEPCLEEVIVSGGINRPCYYPVVQETNEKIRSYEKSDGTKREVPLRERGPKALLAKVD